VIELVLFCRSLCQFVAGDEHQLVTYDSVAGCMCFTQRWTILTCSSRQAAIPAMSSKEHVKCVVHRIPNDRMTAAADLSPAAIALTRVACSPKCRGVVGYSPKFVRQVISFQHGTASLLIGPHIEMGTLCDGSLCIAARSIRARLLRARLRPFYRNYINQSSFVEAVASCRRRCSKRVSQGRH
jgi:hypothetical protein